MLEPSDVVEALLSYGFDFFCGVPCSYLEGLIDEIINHPLCRYVGATSEGEAVAIAAGAWLGGRRPVVLMQNSGLGNAVNPLTSLSYPFHIPMLMVVTWRGEPGKPDEPQHEQMGRITHALLDTLEIEHRAFPAQSPDLSEVLETVCYAMDSAGRPFALIVEKGDIAESHRPRRPKMHSRQPTAVACFDTGEPRLRRHEVLKLLLQFAPENAAVVATTGKTGRELFTVSDRDQHLYLVGSMGCASAIGLGVALQTPRLIVVIDGDGAALMKLGNLATIGCEAPTNLIHIIVDNRVHDSTGGQATASGTLDFAAAAAAASYRQSLACDDANGFERAMALAAKVDGPTLIRVQILPGSLSPLGRPTIPPDQVAQRFRRFVLRA